MERRRQAKPTTASPIVVAPSPPPKPQETIVPMPVVSISPREEPVKETPVLPDAPTDEEIFARLRVDPIVSVSNVTDDDTPWKAKYMAEMAEKRRSVCDQCNKCDGYVSAAKTPGKCADCHCDLVCHLKSSDLDEFKVESDDEEELEWDDDVLDDDDGSGFDDNGDDDQGGPQVPKASSSTDIGDEEQEFVDDDQEGGEETYEEDEE